jgi:hypothetical protein
VLVVKKMVACPFAPVVLLPLENDPFAPVFVQFTVMPDVATALLFVSANCAVTVITDPATGLVLLGVTRYFAPGPETVVKLPLVPVNVCASVPVTV